jgi:hypothetical protein
VTTEEAIEIVNASLHIDGAITHKGDEVKCYVRDIEEGGAHKRYLGVAECQELADAFGFLALKLDAAAQRQGKAE